MAALWLVTPVYGRMGLTRIVLEQRARLIVELAGLGVQAHQLVVGNDANLELAGEHGFHTLVRPNVLGLRINDGFEHAFRNGADHVMYVGSDAWLLAETLADLPPQGKARGSRWVTFVDGELIIPSEGAPSIGQAPWVLSRELLEPVGFRPVPDDRTRLLDTAMLQGLPVHQDVAFEFHPEDDPLRVVEFRGPWAEQMTRWQEMAYPRHAAPNPFERLATRYPADLVERMKEFYP